MENRSEKINFDQKSGILIRILMFGFDQKSRIGIRNLLFDFDQKSDTLIKNVEFCITSENWNFDPSYRTLI